MILKVSKQHRGLKLYKVCINDVPWLTLTYLTARSNLVTCVVKWVNVLQSHLMGKHAIKDQIDRHFNMFIKKF